MDSWKQSLDRWLTTPPDDGFTDFCEHVSNYFSDEFYDKNEDWINSYTGVCNDWLNKLFIKDKSFEATANIIERAHKIYINGHKNRHH